MNDFYTLKSSHISIEEHDSADLQSAPVANLRNTLALVANH